MIRRYPILQMDERLERQGAAPVGAIDNGIHGRRAGRIRRQGVHQGLIDGSEFCIAGEVGLECLAEGVHAASAALLLDPGKIHDDDGDIVGTLA